MSAPGAGDDGVDVALDALRDDAAVWRSASDRLEVRRMTLETVTVDPLAFSQWGVDAGLDRSYEDLRRRIDQVIAQGVEAFRAVSASLDGAASVYGQEDAENAGRFEALRPEGG
ncbi:hypothetical protein [Actinomycetospora flava]|uniref:Excreted virulence factor EspC (Type VII ESX diderm) n=1 Tax=Actinomycetospora flava TaxID=3129232 RepID=A0ABU8M536_9PSEU